MNLKKETINKEKNLEHLLSLMKIRFYKKNPCSYLLYLPQGRVMLFAGKSGIKINAVDKLSCSKKAIEDFRLEIINGMKAISQL